MEGRRTGGRRAHRIAEDAATAAMHESDETITDEWVIKERAEGGVAAAAAGGRHGTLSFLPSAVPPDGVLLLLLLLHAEEAKHDDVIQGSFTSRLAAAVSIHPRMRCDQLFSACMYIWRCRGRERGRGENMVFTYTALRGRLFIGLSFSPSVKLKRSYV